MKTPIITELARADRLNGSAVAELPGTLPIHPDPADRGFYPQTAGDKELPRVERARGCTIFSLPGGLKIFAY